ncbi:MAG: MBL fold metallo-hydrolase [Candidatus Melainabacteria bacterium]|nr:MBL fold metallo-hydrolase [Candidatus Melainabacteria bacterium]
MAQIKLKRPENKESSFYVDETCIDCDTCRWMAPSIYDYINGKSAVIKEATTEQEQVQAMQALISCPTASIGYTGSEIDIKSVQNSFPILIEDNVYHCGYHSEKSFGATSYFIQREAGNILVDSPRFTPALVSKLEELGGLKYIFLTHKDDLADHQKFHEHFGAQRIIHHKELCDRIPNAEIVIEHDYHSKLEDSEDELAIIHAPGHTAGHLLLNYKRQFLFSGDHISYSARLNQLISWKRYCQYSWDKQIESVEKLIEYYWAWLLPGHGRRIKAHPEAYKLHIEQLVEWMKEQ